MSTRAAIAVFLKPAIRGLVKTRLAQVIGEDAAMRLYEAFVKDTLLHVRAVPHADVVFWVAGAVDDPSLNALPSDLMRRAQPEGSLGERMFQVLSVALNSNERALIVGTDAPTLEPGLIEGVLRRLNEADVAFVPSADGGYAVIAARRVHPDMFEGVRMSTEHALSDTCAACSRAGLSWALTPPWFDVDTARDLGTLAMSLTVDPRLAPHTARALRTLGHTRF